MSDLTRRTMMTGALAAAAGGAVRGLAEGPRPVPPSAPGPAFPSTAPERAEEMVRVAHFDLDRVGELLADDRSLALATWDWGFGDWESALGAASHVGRRDIATALLAHGARADLFTLAMLDEIDAVRAICTARPGIHHVAGPHGIPLIAHAVNGGAARVEAYLATLDDGDPVSRPEPSEEELAVYLGSYAYGAGSDERLEVDRRRRGGIGVGRPGKAPRALHPVGDHAFTPAGAPHVTVRFAVVEGRAVGLTIYRGEPILTASRR